MCYYCPHPANLPAMGEESELLLVRAQTTAPGQMSVTPKLLDF